MFMRDTYGGSAIDVFPPIGAKNIARHGLDDFMYLSLLFHCHAPEVPGVPGIYFHVGTDTVIEAYTSKVYRVFVRLASNVWLYVGQYKLRRGAPFSKEEWNAQKPEVGLDGILTVIIRGHHTDVDFIHMAGAEDLGYADGQRRLGKYNQMPYCIQTTAGDETYQASIPD